MKMTTINEAALAAAMDHILGPDARKEVEDLYAVIDKAHADAFVWGRASVDVDTARRDGFQSGFNAGYNEAFAVATSDEQPYGEVICLPPYTGDSGDEDPHMHDSADFDDADGFYDVTGEDDDFDDEYAKQNDMLPPMQEQRNAIVPGQTQFRRYE